MQYESWVEGLNWSPEKIAWDDEIVEELQAKFQPGDNHLFEKALQTAFVGTDQYHCWLRHDDFPHREITMANHPPREGTKKWRNQSEDVESLPSRPRNDTVEDVSGQPIPPTSSTVMKCFCARASEYRETPIGSALILP